MTTDREMLELAYQALCERPSFRLGRGAFKTSYELLSAIEEHLSEEFQNTARPAGD